MKRIGQGAVASGSGTKLYTVPSQYRAAVNDIVVANTGTSALTFKLHLVPVGGSADTTNMMFPDISVPANSMVHWSGNQILNAGDYIQAIGSSTGLTVNITGDEVRL